MHSRSTQSYTSKVTGFLASFLLFAPKQLFLSSSEMSHTRTSSFYVDGKKKKMCPIDSTVIAGIVTSLLQALLLSLFPSAQLCSSSTHTCTVICYQVTVHLNGHPHSNKRSKDGFATYLCVLCYTQRLQAMHDQSSAPLENQESYNKTPTAQQSSLHRKEKASCPPFIH